MALLDKDEYEMDKEDGLVQEKPAVALLKHIHELWPLESKFLATADLIDMLVISHPTVWGSDGPFGKPLTARRLGSILAKGYKIHSKRESRTGPRGYLQFDFVRAWSRMGVTPPPESGASGATGPSGAQEDDRYYLIDPETGQKVWEDTPELRPSSLPPSGTSSPLAERRM